MYRYMYLFEKLWFVQLRSWQSNFFFFRDKFNITKIQSTKNTIHKNFAGLKNYDRNLINTYSAIDIFDPHKIYHDGLY